VSAALTARGVAHRNGRVLAACATADEPVASEVIRELAPAAGSSAAGAS